MRTTVNLDDDVTAALEQLRARGNLGLSEAVNQLIRAGLALPKQRSVFQQRTADLGLTVDVRNVADALELLDGVEQR